ncbi:MAG: competence protein ComEC [Parcubacteria group bacterium Gr01-1014_31]|nr:MAG: competence protein ComEC [Parcubacteria group bacterium Gr01-1014_31]
MSSRREVWRNAVAWMTGVGAALALAGWVLAPMLGRGMLQVRFFDIGQGDAILVTTPAGGHIVVDGGPDGSLLHKLGPVLPLWDRTIELVVLTHPHADHLVGLVELARRYRIKQVLASEDSAATPEYRALEAELARQHIPLLIARGGAVQQLEPRLELRVLYPPAGNPASANPNDASVVLQLVYADAEVLLTGDLEAAAQNALPAAWLASDLLKVAHHGSSDALNLEILGKIKPAVAVISVGENSYGHPSRRVLRALERIPALVLTTQEDGDITATTRGYAWRVHSAHSGILTP